MKQGKIRLMFRGYLGRAVQWEQGRTIPARQLGTAIAKLGEEHAEKMAAGAIDMIEIEFLDEPDINQRFCRLGTNPAGMVMPIELQL